MNPLKLERRALVAADLLKSAANPKRLMILCHLAEGEMSVGELEAQLKMRQPHLSQQLAQLRQAKLVSTRRDSRTIYYRLASNEAQRLISLLYDIYCVQTPLAHNRKKPAKRRALADGAASQELRDH